MSDHAILSASGSKKWLICTPSARLEETFPDEQSEFAAEGTKAHDLMEIIAKHHFHGTEPELFPVETRKQVAPNKESVSFEYVDLMAEGGLLKAGFDMAMQEAVRELMARVMAVTNRLKTDGEAYTVLVEQKLDYSQWAQEGFGTSDITIVTQKKVWVIDLKYGKGIEVSAIENTQMKLYGLGAYNDLSFAYEDIEELSLNIMQPRINNFSTFDISLKDLLAWGEFVKERAALAWEGKGEFVPGDHCSDGFCKARFTCAARANAALRDSGDLPKGPTLTPNDIADILHRLDDIEKWAKDLKGYALKEAVDNGVSFPGYKLVEGRSNRFISDKTKATEILLAEGYLLDEIQTEPVLLGLTALEELVGGKKTFTDLLSPVLVKPAGKPTLVEDGDKRQAWQPRASAEEDFE